jgi:ubiquinone/menaquinone biosynthesis C-methylase UbiE
MHSASELDMQRYYAQRAHEYERIYAKPERQADLAAIKAWLPALFENARVLEIACGTGYWTPDAAARSQSWLATDVNEEVLAIARTKPLPHERVRFEIGDAYALAHGHEFDAAFTGFWWSHVPLERAGDWLAALHRCLTPGGRVVLLDNRYVEGSSTPISRRDAQGNTYQQRRLGDGSTHEVLKNFPDRDGVHAFLGNRHYGFQWVEWDHFWACTYQVI